MSTSNTLATITRRGPDLVVTTCSPVLADHYWLDRASLLRLSGQQRLQLIIELDGESEPLRLFWAPQELPVHFTIPSAFHPQ